MSKITETVAALAGPVAEARGCELWDVEFVREAGEWFLRVYIDKEGGVSIDDCEAVSRALRRPGDFEKFMGSFVAVRLYKAENGVKERLGYLRGYSDGAVTLETKDGGTVTFEKKQVASVHLRLE